VFTRSDIHNIRQFKRLTQLILDYNEISEDSFTSDVEVKRLEHLSVAHNKVTRLPCVIDIDWGGFFVSVGIC
jgi:hypothetical protein